MDLEEFFRVLPYLDTWELLTMSAAYTNADPETRTAARADATLVARRQGKADELRTAHSTVVQWAGSDIPRSSLLTLERFHLREQVLGEVRRQAIPALVDAATALLLDSYLSPGIA